MLIGCLLYYSTVIFLPTIFDRCWSEEGQECQSAADLVAVSPAVSAADFWPWAKQKLMEEIGNNGKINDQNDHPDEENDDQKLIAKFVDDLEQKDKLLEQELLMAPHQKESMNKFKKWYRTRSFCRSRKNDQIDNSKKILKSLSFRSNSRKDDHCNEYKCYLGPIKKLYKETKQFQQQIMSGQKDEDDPNCILAKFRTIKSQLKNILYTVADRYDMEIPEFDGHEKSEKYDKMVLLKKMAKMKTIWNTGKIGKNELEDILATIWNVLSQAENDILRVKSRGNTHRRRKRLSNLVGWGVPALVGVVVLILIIVVPNNKPIADCLVGIIWYGICCCWICQGCWRDLH